MLIFKCFKIMFLNSVTYFYFYICFIPLMSQSFTLPLVCDAFLSHLLLPIYMFTVLLYLISATDEDSLELLKCLVFLLPFK